MESFIELCEPVLRKSSWSSEQLWLAICQVLNGSLASLVVSSYLRCSFWVTHFHQVLTCCQWDLETNMLMKLCLCKMGVWRVVRCCCLCLLFMINVLNKVYSSKKKKPPKDMLGNPLHSCLRLLSAPAPEVKGHISSCWSFQCLFMQTQISILLTNTNMLLIAIQINILFSYLFYTESVFSF